MKKFLLLLFFIPLVSFGQSSFNDGFKAGYKKGYCLEDIGCIPPIPSIPPISKPGFNTYSDGYARGVQDGNRTRQSRNNNYTNPNSSYTSPKQSVVSDAKHFDNLQSQISNNFDKIASSMGASLREQYNSRGLYYLGQGKYYLKEVAQSGFVSKKKVAANAQKTLVNFISQGNHKYEIDSTNQFGRNKPRFGMFGKKEIFFTLLNEDNSPKLSPEEINTKKDAANNMILQQKDGAVKELKKLKELLDLELITQEEFDIKSKELKKIILGN